MAKHCSSPQNILPGYNVQFMRRVMLIDLTFRVDLFFGPVSNRVTGSLAQILMLLTPNPFCVSVHVYHFSVSVSVCRSAFFLCPSVYDGAHTIYR